MFKIRNDEDDLGEVGDLGDDVADVGGKPPAKAQVKKYQKKVYPPEEIRKLLEGYIQVARPKWHEIPTNSHIRYFKKDGSFARGGFVTNHWQKDGQHVIHLATSIRAGGPGYTTWPTFHDNMTRVFKKPDQHSGIEMDVVRVKLNEYKAQLNKLVDIIKHQGAEINSLKTGLNQTNRNVKILYEQSKNSR
jgi:hypothetical protein